MPDRYLPLPRDDLGVGRLVNRDVADPAARSRTGVGRPGALAEPEMLADLLPAADRRGAQRSERVGDIGLPEVYALLVATSQASARARLGEEATTRLLAIVFDGLAPRPATAPQQH
jgi:hypothetical protein